MVIVGLGWLAIRPALEYTYVYIYIAWPFFTTRLVAWLPLSTQAQTNVSKLYFRTDLSGERAPEHVAASRSLPRARHRPFIARKAQQVGQAECETSRMRGGWESARLASGRLGSKWARCAKTHTLLVRFLSIFFSRQVEHSGRHLFD